jgi:hypothetical protein
MAGALLGPVATGVPPTQVIDQEYIRAEAARCGAISRGESVEDFPHPDLLRWKPPRALADVVGLTPDGIAVAGLGPAEELGPIKESGARGDSCWQWLRLEAGETLFVRRRKTLRELHPDQLPKQRPRRATPLPKANTTKRPKTEEPILESTTLSDAVRFVKERNFEPRTIGTLFLYFAERDGGFEQASAFAGAIVEAYRQRAIAQSEPK